jgi:hypothetical protein
MRVQMRSTRAVIEGFLRRDVLYFYLFFRVRWFMVGMDRVDAEFRAVHGLYSGQIDQRI